SEEHTSELQSLTNLVCRLLLEKKKDRQEADLEDGGLSDDRADRGPDREHNRADPETEGREAEQPMHVEREGGYEAVRRAVDPHARHYSHLSNLLQLRPCVVAPALQPERREPRRVSLFDQRAGDEDKCRSGDP